MPVDWSAFDYTSILKEARQRFEQAETSSAEAITAEKRTLEYWVAWVTHANAVAVSEHEPQGPDPSEDRQWKMLKNLRAVLAAAALLLAPTAALAQSTGFFQIPAQPPGVANTNLNGELYLQSFPVGGGAAYTEINGVETALPVSAAQQFTGTAANYVFTITGTVLTPGAHISIEVTMLVTTSVGALTGQINSVSYQG